jgi:high-affinity iron transporter
MLVPFLIMLREGIEASLIVGIIAGYLSRTGRSEWMPVVWLGVLLAVALALFAGAALQLVSAEFPQKAQELFEAVVGLVAVAILCSMVFWMRKAGRSMKSGLQHAIDSAFATTRGQAWALIVMVFLAVAREGLESVFFLLAVFQQSSGPEAPTGALLGILLAAGLGYGIYLGGVKLNLRRFFRWTGAFVLVVAAGILANSVGALHEAGIWNGLQQTAFDLSGILPADSPVGTVLSGILGYNDAPSIGEAMAYLAFLAVSLYLFLMPEALAEARTAPATGRGAAKGASS